MASLTYNGITLNGSCRVSESVFVDMKSNYRRRITFLDMNAVVARPELVGYLNFTKSLRNSLLAPRKEIEFISQDGFTIKFHPATNRHATDLALPMHCFINSLSDKQLQVKYNIMVDAAEDGGINCG